MTKILLVVLLAFGGCSTTVPQCHDEAVISLVEEISRNEFKDALVRRWKNYWHLSGSIPDGFPSDTDELPPSDVLEQEAESRATGMEMTVSAIRRNHIDADSRLTACAANLTTDGSERAIDYTAQYTTDGGELYVTVYGL